MNQKSIIECCKELGCCDACCLRFLGLKSPAAYENPKQYVINALGKQGASVSPALVVQVETVPAGNQTEPAATAPGAVSEPPHAASEPSPAPSEPSPAPSELSPATSEPTPDVSEPSPAASEPTPGASEPPDDANEPPNKKMKVDGVCTTCLGLLQQENWPQCNAMVKTMLDKKRYECETFACALSAPVAALLRERVVALRLRDACANYDDGALTPLKEAWKWSFGAQLARHVGLALDSGAVSPLLVTLHMEYLEEAGELEALRRVAPELFARRSASQRFAVEFTRRAVEQALAGASLAALRAAGCAAPAAASRAVCAAVSAQHAPLYLGGRYVKLSRTLPQTPWLVNGRRMLHSSVQELICAPIAALYRLDAEDAEHRLKFMSAGREDVDVRCLGDGRPFAIEITDPTRQPSEAELQQLCAQISAGGQVLVRRLVPVSREHLALLKKGEETKCKTYEALCIKLSHAADEQLPAAAPVRVTERDLQRVNAYSNCAGARVLLQQRTPIRVLHRRPLHVRPRRILALSAHAVPAQPQLLLLRLRTDAGLYVKEWAHGELGRTRPALADALQARVDILALDVAEVDLAWP
nr:putative tRNA pseudouridine synthase Pus10 [Helicoverpa armigera]